MAITLKDFEAFVQKRMNEGMGCPGLFGKKLQEVFDFASANKASMDAEALAYLDKLYDAIISIFERGLVGVADSADKRKMLRLIALTRQKHHSAEILLKGLGRPLPTPLPIAEEAKPIFLDALQSVLDLLFDVTRTSQNGPAQFASLSMLFWTVDELNVAFYLAERKYTTQAYSHLRTVHELLENANLFFQQPEWAELWAGKDKKKILRELSPKGVRLKLGKPKVDAVYSFLTEMGAHGTFAAVQRRVIKRPKVINRTQIAMWIGGVPFDDEVGFAVSSCILSVCSTLIAVVTVYGDRLHGGEVATILRARFEKAKEFLQKHVLETSRNSGVDVSAITETLRQLGVSLQNIEKHATP